MIKHSIISWDCCFRERFHLLTTLAGQDFCGSEFEVIFVEQRSKSVANKIAYERGVPSLEECIASVSEKICARAIYLNTSADDPYHLGICNNAGIQQARGDIISVMDGDTLVRPGFLNQLSQFHEDRLVVGNLHRLMCQYPVGVSRFREWKSASMGFEQCLRACTGAYLKRWPEKCDNKGPMISAKRELWEATAGYDDHPVWSTSASTAGMDMNMRLEIAGKTESQAIPDAFCVHPWHPVGYAQHARESSRRVTEAYFGLQKAIRQWTLARQLADWRERTDFVNDLCRDYQDVIDQVHQEDAEQRRVGVSDRSSLDRATWPSQLSVSIKRSCRRALEMLSSRAC